jgi:DNA-binding ferritin-like protein
MTISELAGVFFWAFAEVYKIHLGIRGPHFDTIHAEVTDRLKDELLDMFDRVAESAIEHGEPVADLNDERPSLLPPGDLDYDQAVQGLETILGEVVEAIDGCEAPDRGVDNMLGDLAEKTRKQRNFFKARRFPTPHEQNFSTSV